MHSVQRDGPATKVATDPAAVWAGIGSFFTDRLAALQAAGIGPERLIIDPGLGYFLGSNPEPSLVALAGIRHLKARFGLPGPGLTVPQIVPAHAHRARYR